MTINYTCKFCGVPGTATADDDCPIQNIEAWRSWLCCNRCGAFQEWYRRMTAKIRHLCIQWATKRPEARQEARDEYSKALTSLTQTTALQVCRYYRVDYVWDYDFVAQLIERPDKAEFIVKAYEDIVRRTKLAKREIPQSA